MNFPTEYQLLFESIFALPQPSPLIWLVDMEKNGLTGMIAEGGGVPSTAYPILRRSLDVNPWSP